MLDGGRVVGEPPVEADLRPVARVRDGGEVGDLSGTTRSVARYPSRCSSVVRGATSGSKERAVAREYGDAHPARVRAGDQAPGAREVGGAPRPAATGARRVRAVGPVAGEVRRQELARGLRGALAALRPQRPRGGRRRSSAARRTSRSSNGGVWVFRKAKIVPRVGVAWSWPA